MTVCTSLLYLQESRNLEEGAPLMQLTNGARNIEEMLKKASGISGTRNLAHNSAPSSLNLDSTECIHVTGILSPVLYF